jgi:hypothetical protein
MSHTPSTSLGFHSRIDRNGPSNDSDGATVPVATMIYPLITIVYTITIAMDQVCIMIRNLG